MTEENVKRILMVDNMQHNQTTDKNTLYLIKDNMRITAMWHEREYLISRQVTEEVTTQIKEYFIGNNEIKVGDKNFGKVKLLVGHTTQVLYANTHWDWAIIRINEAEKKDYLNCKFWKESKEEAQLFGSFYAEFKILYHLHLCTALLLGAKTDKEMMSFMNLSMKAFNAYYKQDHVASLPYERKDTKEDTDDIKHIKPILKELMKIIDKKMTIQELFEWADDKNITSKKLRQNNIVTILKAPMFKKPATLDKSNIKILKPIINKKLYLTYEDAKIMFFPDSDISIDTLKEAVRINEIIGHFQNKEEHVNYFIGYDLLKWLMKKRYLTEWLTHEFIDLKIETLIEAQVNHFDVEGIKPISLKNLIEKKGESKDNIFDEGIRGKVNIFLKFTQEIKYKKNVIQKMSKFQQTRYKGFGQLYARDKDCNEEQLHAEIFGNVTLEMIYRRAKSENYCNNEKFGGVGNGTHTIYLIPTEEEAKYHLQPYIEVSPQEIEALLSDDNLMVIKEGEIAETQKDIWLHIIKRTS